MMNDSSVERLLAEAWARRRSGDLRQAENLCRQALAQAPADFRALHLLGEIAYLAGQPRAAAELLNKAVAGAPDRAELHNLLAVALFALGENEKAIAAYREALRLAPRYVEALSNLAEALRATGRTGEAIAACHAALAIQPGQPGALVNLGNALRQEGKLEEAAAAFSEALRSNPNWPIIPRNLGIVLLEMGRLIEARDALGRAVQLDPRDAEAHNALGNAIRLAGRPEEALSHLRHAVALRPESAIFQSNLLFALNYCSSFTPEAIYAEHLAWGKRCVETIGTHEQWANDRNPDRPLRIGYVSPDFRAHSIAFFIEPILEHHDRSESEVFGYACHARSDSVTRSLQQHCRGWRNISTMSDEQAARVIRADGIDILVDLAVHSPNNRLMLFARKPAPVQVSYLGYAGTTGLPTMDYRLTDALVDPPGLTQTHHVERLLRLPRTLWCFRPPQQSPEVAPPPSLGGAPITFGSANMPAKITPEVIALWAKVLQATPGSRLLCKGWSLEDPGVQRGFIEAFGACGIDPDRLGFSGQSNLPEFLEFFSMVDAVLDTFPFNGGTITCLALWMGVPVITLTQDRSVSRVGASVLTNLGLENLIANTPEDYLRIARALAGDVQKLAELRAGMRPRMRSSALMDEQEFAWELENAYRTIWRQWCASTRA